MKHIREITI